MYYQFRLVVYLYLMVGLSKPQEYWLSSSGVLSNGSNEIPISNNFSPCALKATFDPDQQILDGTGCTLSVSCPVRSSIGREEALESRGAVDEHPASNELHPALNVTLALGIPDKESTELRRCKDAVDAFLLMNPHFQNPNLIFRKPTYSRRHSLHRGEPEPTPSEPDEMPETGTSTQTYRGIFDSLLSSIQRRVIQVVKGGEGALLEKLKPLRFWNSPIGSSREQGRTFLKRCAFLHSTRCEETICGDDSTLERICGLNSRSRGGEEIERFCRACYPRKNNFLVKDMCAKRKIKEAQVIHTVLVFMGVALVLAALLYGTCKHLTRRRQRRNSINETETKGPGGNDGTSFGFDMNTTPAVVPGLLPTSVSRENPSAPNDVQGSETAPSSLRQKLNQFGVFRRDRRRRIQDLFDLESLRPRRDEDESSKRVPVLPRAPNASIRGYFKDSGMIRIREEHESSLENTKSRSTSISSAYQHHEP